MQSIQDLNLMVKRGGISQEEAQRCLAAVMSEMSEHYRELEDSGMTKTASMGKSVLTALLTSAALTAGGLGVNYAVNKYEEAKLDSKQQKAYDDMLRLDPDLKSIPRERIQEYAGIFKTVAPTMATNPHLMGNFVKRQAASYGGVGFEEAGQLARAEQAISGGKGPGIGKQLADNLINQGVGTLGQNVNMIARSRIERDMYDPVSQGENAARMRMAQNDAFTKAGRTPEGVLPKSAESQAEEQGRLSGIRQQAEAKFLDESRAAQLGLFNQPKTAGAYHMMGNPFTQVNKGMLYAMVGG